MATYTNSRGRRVVAKSGSALDRKLKASDAWTSDKAPTQDKKPKDDGASKPG